MNAKQTIPLVTTLATAIPAILPPLLIGGAIFFALKWLLSDDDKEKKPETVPVNAEAELRRKEAETNAFRRIPAEIHVKPANVPVPRAPRPVVPPPAVPSVPKVSAPTTAHTAVAVPKIVIQSPSLPPTKKKFVAREDLATVFQWGARSLTRTAAVAALKRLGFGKTAAYGALSPDGRFSAWLQCAPDGIITWKS